MKNPTITQILMQTALLLLSCTVSIDAAADTDKQVIHHMQLQLRAAQQEKAELTDQVDALKKQLAELESKRAALEKKLSGQSRQISELSDKQLSDTQQLADLSGKYKLLEQQYTESNNNLKQTQMEKDQQKTQLDGDIRQCWKMNSVLYQLNVKLMDKYQAKGVWDAILQAEPFTQLEKVKMENLMQEYRDQSGANRITSASSIAQDARQP